MSDSDVSLLYHPAQQAFLAALAQRTPQGTRAFDRLVVLSGRQGGKSKIGGIAAARESSTPNTIGWACAPSYPELHDYVIPSLRAAIPDSWIVKWSEQHQEFTLVNGSRIQCRSLDDPERGRGGTLHWLWIDEGRKVEELAYLTILPALARHKAPCWVTTSVNGFDWVYKHFWRPAQDGRAGYWGIKYRSQDNPALDAETIQAMREPMGETFARQELDAEFVHFTGAVYGDLIDPQVLTPGNETLVIPEWPLISPTRHAIVAIDPGTDHPFGAVLLVLTEHGIVVCGEYLERHRPIADHVVAIKKMVGGLRDVQYGYDRSARQIALELTQHGIFAAPAENSVEAGIRRVESWLRTKRIWFLESAVPRTIQQMRAYRWANNIGRDGQARNKERVFKVEDELPDAVRYGLMLWPELPEATAPLPGRRIETIPEEARWAWDRERRLSGWTHEDEAVGGLGDFFGGA